MEKLSRGSKMHLLEVENLTKNFGGVTALNEFSFSVDSHEIIAVIGPNGAGKSTLFNVITKIHPATNGIVKFKGEDITKLKAHDIAVKGVSRTFQDVRTLNEMTTLENIMIGCHRTTRTGLFSSFLYLPRVRKEIEHVKELSMKYLELVGLDKTDADKPAGALPYGARKLVELARALVSDPELLLLDEPATGLNDVEREHMAQLLFDLRKMGKTWILVEHQMEFVMGSSDRVIVLDFGNKIAEGTPDEIKKNPEAIAAYLGEEDYA